MAPTPAARSGRDGVSGLRRLHDSCLNFNSLSAETGLVDLRVHSCRCPFFPFYRFNTVVDEQQASVGLCPLSKPVDRKHSAHPRIVAFRLPWG